MRVHRLFDWRDILRARRLLAEHRCGVDVEHRTLVVDHHRLQVFLREVEPMQPFHRTIAGACRQGLDSIAHASTRQVTDRERAAFAEHLQPVGSVAVAIARCGHEARAGYPGCGYERHGQKASNHLLPHLDDLCSHADPKPRTQGQSAGNTTERGATR